MILCQEPLCGDQSLTSAYLTAMRKCEGLYTVLYKEQIALLWPGSYRKAKLRFTSPEHFYLELRLMFVAILH